MKGKNVKKTLAFLLSSAVALSSGGMAALAEEADQQTIQLTEDAAEAERIAAEEAARAESERIAAEEEAARAESERIAAEEAARAESERIAEEEAAKAESEMTETNAAETEPEATEPAETEPAATEPSETEPAVTEPTETETTEASETEPETEKQSEKLFEEGYSLLKKDTVLYKDRDTMEILGRFKSDSHIYILKRFADDGDEDSNNDWMHIAFAIWRDGSVEMEEGYVRADRVVPVPEKEQAEEAEKLAEDASHILYKENSKIILVPADFEAEVQETEAEPETETEPEVYTISAHWDDETLEIGDSITLTAQCEEEKPVFWQTSEDGTNWVPVAEGVSYEFELTEENCQMLFRAVSGEMTEEGK